MALSKLLTITLILNLVASTLQSQFIQDDILAFPRYKIVLTRDKVSNADITIKNVEVVFSPCLYCRTNNHARFHLIKTVLS
jgi:hypothetical protein